MAPYLPIITFCQPCSHLMVCFHISHTHVYIIAWCFTSPVDRCLMCGYNWQCNINVSHLADVNHPLEALTTKRTFSILFLCLFFNKWEHVYSWVFFTAESRVWKSVLDCGDLLTFTSRALGLVHDTSVLSSLEIISALKVNKGIFNVTPRGR